MVTGEKQWGCELLHYNLQDKLTIKRVATKIIKLKMKCICSIKVEIN